MPQPVPYTTGNDLLAYKGDAGLAAGTNPGGILPQQGDPYGGISNALDKIQEVNSQKAVLKYQQQLSDRENLRKMLAETGGSVFNMKGANGQNVSFRPLAEDRPALQSAALNQHKFMQKNWDRYWLKPEWADMQENYNNLVGNAGMRSVARSNYQQQMAQENEPDEQQKIKDWDKQEIGAHSLNEAYDPHPYLQALPANLDNLIAKEDLAKQTSYDTTVNSNVDANGNLVETTKNRLNPSVGDFRSRIYPGQKGYRDAASITRDYFKNIVPNITALQSHNNNIDKLNKEYGYVDENGKPTSSHYIPHIADVIANPDGSKQTKINTANPADVAYALMMEQRGNPQVTSKIVKTALDIQKEKADIADTNDDSDLREKIREFDIEHPGGKPKEKPTPEELKENEQKSIVQQAYDQYNNLFEKYKSKGSDVAHYPNFWKAQGIDPDKYTIYPAIPPSEEVKKYLGSTGTTDIIDKDSGKRTGVTPTYPTYTKVVPLENKQTGDKNLAYFNGNELVAIKNPHQVVSNRLIEDADHKAPQYEPQLAWVDNIISGKTTPNSPTAAAPPPQNFTPTINGQKAEVRNGSDGKPEVLVNGAWKKVTGRKKNGELITE